MCIGFMGQLQYQGRRKQFSVGAVMVCARSACEIFNVTLIIHEQSRTFVQ